MEFGEATRGQGRDLVPLEEDSDGVSVEVGREGGEAPEAPVPPPGGRVVLVATLALLRALRVCGGGQQRSH